MTQLTSTIKELNPIPEDISFVRHVLRQRDDVSLRRRRKIIALSAAGVLDFCIISLFQTGIIKSLPDLPFRVFDSNSVNSSTKAYATGLPDGTSGATMFAVTMMLASYGGNRSSGRKAYWDKLLFGVVGLGAVAGAQYLYDMTFKQKKICLYCVTGAGLSFSMLPLAIKELKEKNDSTTEYLH